MRRARVGSATSSIRSDELDILTTGGTIRREDRVVLAEIEAPVAAVNDLTMPQRGLRVRL